MLKTGILIAGLFSAGIVLCSQEQMIRLGNMDNLQAKDLLGECVTNGGKVSFFTEEYTWNRCGKYELTKIAKSGPHDLVNATLFIGKNLKKAGFICKPETAYEFSIDIKGNAPQLEIKAVGWDKGKTFYGFTFLSKKYRTIPGKEWVTVKGEFKTGPDTERAAIVLQFWESSKFGPIRFKVGDYVLFDNISVKEKKQKSGKAGTCGRFYFVWLYHQPIKNRY